MLFLTPFRDFFSYNISELKVENMSEKIGTYFSTLN
jgi:hypothetical protein